MLQLQGKDQGLKNVYTERMLMTIRDFGKPGIYVHYGPFGCGKTFSCCTGFGLLLKRTPVTDVGYAVMAQSIKQCKKIICSELIKLFGDDFKYVGGEHGSSEFKLFGHTVYMVGLSDSKSEERIRGINVRGIYMEEGTLCTPDLFDLIFGRLRDLTSDSDSTWFVISTNPGAKKHWLKQYIDDKSMNIKGIHWTEHDSGTAGSKKYYEGLRKKYAKSKSNLLRYVYGLWESAEGQVYSCFDSSKHVIEYSDIDWDAISYIKIGLDYGMNHATAVLFVAYCKSTRENIVFDELYLKDTTNSDISNKIINKINCLKKRVQGIYFDPSARSMFVQLSKDGLKNIHKARNDVIPGISVVYEEISSDRLFICSNCEMTIDEFEKYVYKSNTDKDEVVKENDHCMDALRYCIYTPIYEEVER